MSALRRQNCPQSGPLVFCFLSFFNYLILLIIAFKLNTLVSVHSFIMSNGVFQAGEQSMLLGLSGLLNLSTFILFFF